MSRWLPAALIMLTAGCSAQGRSEYGCPGLPDGVVCRDTRATYVATSNVDRLLADQRSQESEGRSSGGIAGDAPAGAIAVPAGEFLQGAPIIPIRSPAVVMRVWIAPWQDESGDLMMPGYVMTEIEARRWQIGHDVTVMPSSDYYLQPVPSKNPAPVAGAAPAPVPTPAPANGQPPAVASTSPTAQPVAATPAAAQPLAGTVGRGRVSVTVAPGQAP